MPDQSYSLVPKVPNNAVSAYWPTLSICETTGGELCSLTVSEGSLDALIAAFEQKFSSPLPSAGKLSCHDGGFAFWTAPNQWFVATETTDEFAELTLREKLGITALTSLQTDGWTQFEIAGPDVFSILERLITIDLNESVFPPGSAARTQAHHLNLFLLRLPASDFSFRLLCARSYSASLFQALTRTAASLLGPSK